MKRFILTLTIAIGLLLLITTCGDLGDQGIGGTGTITYSSLEGGCWGINLDHGGHYEIWAYDLPQEFQQPGLRVWIDARLSRSQISYCGSSDGIIDILKIQRL